MLCPFLNHESQELGPRTPWEGKGLVAPASQGYAGIDMPFLQLRPFWIQRTALGITKGLYPLMAHTLLSNDFKPLFVQIPEEENRE